MASRDPGDSAGTLPSKLSLSQRILLSLPRLKHDRDGAEKLPLSEWLKKTFMKPVGPGAESTAKAQKLSLEELETEAKYADDKERLIGLVGAPLAAAIGLLVIDALISHDPAALLKNGHVNNLHVSVSLYHELELVLLGLSLVMLLTAWFRKRLYLGMVFALYGLAIFNLRYWGFGIPFVMVGAWLLVRSYRVNRDLKEARGKAPNHPRDGRASLTATRPLPTKRYTQPTSRPKRLAHSRPVREKRAG